MDGRSPFPPNLPEHSFESVCPDYAAPRPHRKALPRRVPVAPASSRQAANPAGHPPARLSQTEERLFVFNPFRKKIPAHRSPRAPPATPLPRMALRSRPSTGQATQPLGPLDIFLTGQYCHLHSILGRSVWTLWVSHFQACIYLALDRDCPTPYLPAPISNIRSLA